MKKLLPLLLILLPFFASAQTDALASIRKHYQETKASVALAKDGEEGALYCNQLVQNVYKASWRAVGTFHKSLTFWFDDQPGMACDEVNGNEACHLQFIIEDAKVSAGGWYSEFLFDRGVLIFAYLITDTGELRFYWQNGNLIRFQKDEKLMDIKENESRAAALEVWKAGQDFRKMYISLFLE
ncbi:MAG: hypothetical protein H6581_22870 [Bacteroidia bacterium]|nr:hypothetical protein [Bacteroidia bacterium]